MIQVCYHYGHSYKFITLFDVINRATPMGIKDIPITANTGKTVCAVRIGCQAGNFCCLNLESVIN